MCCSFQKRTTEDSDSPHKSYCCYKVTVVLHSGISQSIPIQSVRMHCDNPRCCNSSGRICSLLPVMYQLLPSAFKISYLFLCCWFFDDAFGFEFCFNSSGFLPPTLSGSKFMSSTSWVKRADKLPTFNVASTIALFFAILSTTFCTL